MAFSFDFKLFSIFFEKKKVTGENKKVNRTVLRSG